MPTMPKALVGAAGEFYVLFRLHAIGLVAAAAPRNAERVDIFAFRPTDRTRVVDLQVKTRTKEISEGGWIRSTKMWLTTDSFTSSLIWRVGTIRPALSSPARLSLTL
jgi:hypothetical protein